MKSGPTEGKSKESRTEILLIIPSNPYIDCLQYFYQEIPRNHYIDLVSMEFRYSFSFDSP